jgi:hypothetical protein
MIDRRTAARAMIQRDSVPAALEQPEQFVGDVQRPRQSGFRREYVDDVLPTRTKKAGIGYPATLKSLLYAYD